MRGIRSALAAAACLTVIGCGLFTQVPVAPPTVTGEPVFQQLAEIYKYISYQRAKVPASAADLEEYSGTVEDALKLIHSGDVRVIWGVGYSSGSNEVLAFDKLAASSGGFVLLRNGTVKQVTPAEFQAASKPAAYKP